MSFGIEAVLFPVFVQVGITFFLLFWTARLRIAALRGREVAMADIALGQPAWPERPTQIANAFHNQLELPLLFYVLVILALFTRKADTFFVVMEWMFVATRLVHAAIHVTKNDVRLRFYAFAVGAVLLLIMWILFVLRLLFAGL
jgi:hypothetical protein